MLANQKLANSAAYTLQQDVRSRVWELTEVEGSGALFGRGQSEEQPKPRL